MTIHGFRGAQRRPVLFAVVALGIALGASGALAQAAQGDQSPPASTATTDKGDPDAVVVHGQHRRPPPTYGASSEAQALAARQQAWREYRDSTPNPTPGSCPTPPDPAQGAGCATFQGLKDYPGLHDIGQ